MRGRRRRDGSVGWKMLAVYVGCMMMLAVTFAYIFIATEWFPVAWIPAVLGAGCFFIGVWWTVDIVRERRAEESRRSREETWIN